MERIALLVPNAPTTADLLNYGGPGHTLSHICLL